MKKQSEKVATFNYFDWAVPDTTQKFHIYARKTVDESSMLHRHTYIEFFYVTEGSGTHILNGENLTVEAGAACLLTQNDVHGFYYDGCGEFRHIDILIETKFFKDACNFFHADLYKELTEGKISKKAVLSFEQIATLNKYVPYLLLSPNNILHTLAAKSILSTILLLLTDNYFEKNEKDFPEWLIKLLAKLNSPDNFASSVADLAEEFAYNQDYMRRIFKERIGTTMTNYFNQRKLDYAYQLLQDTNYSIEQISEIVGINNVSHFYHLFKKQYHRTPAEIKKRTI